MLKKTSIKSFIKTTAVAAIAGTTLYAGMALATNVPIDVTDIQKTMQGSVGSIADIIEATFLVVGVFLFGSGLFKIRQHVLAPHQHPVSQGIIALVLGVGCFTVPTIMTAAAGSIFGKSNVNMEATGSTELNKIINAGGTN